MVDFTLDIVSRADIGKSANNRLRALGQIPGIAYAHGVASKPVAVGEKQFLQLARQAGVSQVFNLKSNDSAISGRSAIVKEIQRDTVKNKVLHVDLQLLRDDEEISLKVRLAFTGEAPGVKVGGGILTIATHTLGIKCLPKYIPQVVSVDISALELGASIHAEAIKLPEGVKLSGNPEESIVSVVAPRAAEEATTTAAATPAEGEAAAAAPAADGAAPAKAADGAAAKAGDAKAAAPAKGKEKK